MKNEFYKSILKNQETRFKVLNFFSFVPDKFLLGIEYRMKTGRKINFKDPQRFTEKVQLYKMKYRNPTITNCVDKYNVRKFVSEKVGPEILIPLLGAYNKPEEINLSDFPDKFIIKTTNGSGTNIVCEDKDKFDWDNSKLMLNDFLKRNIYSSAREWAYKDVTPKIIVEPFLEEENSQFNGLNDYKIFCFNGEPRYIVVDVNRAVSHKRNIYDLEWNNLNVATDHPVIDEEVKKPDNLSEMLDIAKRLAQDFPFVRVDLYSLNNKIYFGELTFYPWSGFVSFYPDSFDFELGRLFTNFD